MLQQQPHACRRGVWLPGRTDRLPAALCPFNRPFDSSLESWPQCIKPSAPNQSSAMHTSAVIAGQGTLVCLSQFCCCVAGGSGEARQSAPVDRQLVLHTHFCLISLLRECCKNNYNACCAYCMCWKAPVQGLEQSYNYCVNKIRSLSKYEYFTLQFHQPFSLLCYFS